MLDRHCIPGCLLVAVSGGCSLVAVHGLPAAGASLAVSAAPGCAGSVAAAPGLQRTGSALAAPGLSCAAACGIFPDRGSNLCLLR